MKDEDELFRDAMDGVEPLNDSRADPRTVPAAHKRKTELTAGQRQRQHDAVNDKRDEADPNYLDLTEVHTVHPLEVLEWKKDGVQPEVFGKLKTGRYPVEGTI